MTSIFLTVGGWRLCNGLARAASVNPAIELIARFVALLM